VKLFIAIDLTTEKRVIGTALAPCVPQRRTSGGCLTIGCI
jgi:hypothetical protein